MSGATVDIVAGSTLNEAKDSIGGKLNVAAGSGSLGGSVSVSGGSGTTGEGGSVSLQAGEGSGVSSGGSVLISAGESKEGGLGGIKKATMYFLVLEWAPSRGAYIYWWLGGAAGATKSELAILALLA